MSVYFLGNEYVALALINAKKQFLNESFITSSELNQFKSFLQQEFNNRGLNIIIPSYSLSSKDFNIMGDVIMTSNDCAYNIASLPLNVLEVLYDYYLIIDFLLQLENDKLKKLEKKKEPDIDDVKIYIKLRY